MSKTGPTFVISAEKMRELVAQVDDLNTQDTELLEFANYFRNNTNPLVYMAVAEEDFILWPDGPDIRDYQIGGRSAKVHLIHGGNVYSNDPADLPSRQTGDENPGWADGVDHEGTLESERDDYEEETGKDWPPLEETKS